MNIDIKELYCKSHGGIKEEEKCIRCTRTDRDRLREENRNLLVKLNGKDQIDSLKGNEMSNEDTSLIILKKIIAKGCKQTHPSGYYKECRYCLGGIESDQDHYEDCLWVKAKNFLSSFDKQKEEPDKSVPLLKPQYLTEGYDPKLANS